MFHGYGATWCVWIGQSNTYPTDGWRPPTARHQWVDIMHAWAVVLQVLCVRLEMNRVFGLEPSGWFRMNLVFWDEMNLSHVWFEGRSRSSFLFDMRDGTGWDGWYH
jgi:hypothetical protein